MEVYRWQKDSQYDFSQLMNPTGHEMRCCSVLNDG